MKKGLLALSVFLISAAATAQDLGGGGFGVPDKPSLNFEMQTEKAPDSHPGLWIEEQKGSFAIPLWGEATGDRYGISVKGQRTVLGDAVRFSGKNVEVPREFGTGEIGLGWSRVEESGDRKSFSFSYGSAGKRLLDNGLSPILGATYSQEWVKEDGNSWMAFLNYSNNRVLLNNIPLPGIAYVIKGKTSRIMIGAPFVFAAWWPDPWMASAVASPWGVSSEGSYRFWGPLAAYSGIAWLPKSYQNLVEGSDERLIFEKKEFSLGLKALLGRQAQLSFGYLKNFDRRLVLGRSISDTSSESIVLDDSDGFVLKGRFSF